MPSGSPVIEDWLTTASPSATVPSAGIIEPARTISRSPARSSENGISTSAPSFLIQTLSTRKRKALRKVFLRAVLRPRLHFFGERHERHYNAGGRNVAAQYRAGYGGGVKYGYVEPPQEEKSLQPARDVGCGAPQAYYRGALCTAEKAYGRPCPRPCAAASGRAARRAAAISHALVVFARHYGYGG